MSNDLSALKSDESMTDPDSTEANTKPVLDPAKIEFPTDLLTFGQLRRHEPARFDVARVSATAATEIEAVAAHVFELKLAHKAFAMETGASDPFPHTDRRWLIHAVSDAYQSLGICSGLKHATELARSIERAANQQAAARFGQGPGRSS